MPTDDVELRGMMPRRVVDIIDAVSAARRMARNELAIEILAAWANDQVHVAETIRRVVAEQSAADGSGFQVRSVKRPDK